MLYLEIKHSDIEIMMRRSPSHLHIHNIYGATPQWAPGMRLLSAGQNFLATLNPFTFCLIDSKLNTSALFKATKEELLKLNFTK